MKIIAKNAAQAASASCRAVGDNVQGWLICAYYNYFRVIAFAI